VPEEAWHGCEPAMSIVPNFLFTGIIAILLSAVLLVWTVWFVERRYGGWVGINRPLPGTPGRLTRFAARLWPWSLVIFVAWTLGQIPVGHFFNDFLQGIMSISMVVILTSMPIAVYSAYAHDTTA